jgi:hypothetical protein
MNNLEKRINKLEHRFGTARDAARYVVIMADRDLSAEEDAYVEMLHKAGMFPGGVVSMVDFMSIPPGSTAIEIERFVRENEAMSTDGRIKPQDGGERTPIIQRRAGIKDIEYHSEASPEIGASSESANNRHLGRTSVRRLRPMKASDDDRKLLDAIVDRVEPLQTCTPEENAAMERFSVEFERAYELVSSRHSRGRVNPNS